MTDDTPSPPPLFARLVEGAVGFMLVGLVLGWVLSTVLRSGLFPSRGVLPWSTLGDLRWAGIGFGLVSGLGFGLAGHLHDRSRGISLVLLGFAPLAVLAAHYSVALSQGQTPWEFLPQLPTLLERRRVVPPMALALVWGAACFPPLLEARAAGRPARRQSEALALGGLTASLLAWLVWPREGGQEQFFSLGYALPLREVNELLILFLGPACLIPGALFCGGLIAAYLLRKLDQPLATDDPRSLRERLREAGWRLLLSTRGALSPPGALTRARSVALLTEHPQQLRAITIALALGLVPALWVDAIDPFEGLGKREVPLIGQAVVLLGVASNPRLPAAEWKIPRGLLLSGVPVLIWLFVAHGAYGLAAAFSAALIALITGRILPFAALLVLAAAWPATSRVGLYLPLAGYPGAVEVGPLARSAFALAILSTCLYGERALKSLLFVVAFGAAGAWIAGRWLQALYTETLILWLFAVDLAFLAGVLGGLLGGWAAAGRGRRRLGVTALLLCALLLSERHLEGDLGESRSTRQTRALAESGDLEAMLELSQRLRTGRGIVNMGTASQQEAYVWLRRAAEAGAPEAMFRLAQEIAHGRTPLPRRQASLWFERAAVAGHEGAIEHLKSGRTSE